MRPSIFCSESVTCGHPDKLCDQISDAIVDAHLWQDPGSRVAAECAVSTGILFLAVRAASAASVDLPGLARAVIREIGYDEAAFSARSCTIMTSLDERDAQPAPARGALELAGDALDRIAPAALCTVFGYACDHTRARLPLPIWLAHRIARQFDDARRDKSIEGLGADAKTQVAVEFEDGEPRRIHSVALVASHTCARTARPPSSDELVEAVLRPAFADEPLRPDGRTQIAIDSGLELGVGGPAIHSGLTGRKTGVDTYGEFSRQGAAALSGKDPLRVDRAGAYAARHAAVNVVAAGLARRCEVQLSYSIGRAHPVSISVGTFGTGRVDDSRIAAALPQELDLRLGAVVRRFQLREQPQQRGGAFYRRLAAYGHMGRLDLELPWERADAADSLERRLSGAR